MSQNEEQGLDFNKRRLEKLTVERNVLGHVIAMIENNKNPLDVLKLNYQKSVEDVNDLEKIVKEPLDILDTKDIVKDLRAIFIKAISCVELTEEQRKNIEEKINNGSLLHKDDIYRYLNYQNSLSFSLWKEDRKIDLKFWKEIVVENSKINNAPYEVANESLKALEKQFYDPSNYKRREIIK